MTNKELYNKIIERSDEEYDKFINSVDHMYNYMKDTVGYNEELFILGVAESYRKAGIDPQIATTLIYFFRKRVKELLTEEGAND